MNGEVTAAMLRAEADWLEPPPEPEHRRECGVWLEQDCTCDEAAPDAADEAYDRWHEEREGA